MGVRLAVLLGELRRFLRIDTSMLVTGIALTGYLTFSEPGPGWVFLASAIFFGTSAQYSYNYCTDREEDAVNLERLNYFVTSRKGYAASVACAVISIASVLQLNAMTVWIYSISMVAGFAYSFLRVKKILLVKNLYTGTFMSSTFLMGAAAGGSNLAGILPYIPFVFLFCTMGNLLGDVRGYEGDRLAGLKTIPIMFSRRMAKYIIYITFLSLSVFSITLGYLFLLPMIPSMAATSFFLSRDSHRMARSSYLSTFIVMAPSAAVMRFSGILCAL